MNRHVTLIIAAVLVVIAAVWIFSTRPALAPGGGEVATTTTDGGGGGEGILPFQSGVRGTVLLGPTCPVERIPPDPMCADRPYETSIFVYRAGASALFAQGTSDAAGVFQFALPPGDYVLKAGGASMLPRCSPASVTVGPSGYATTTVFCDTGIR